jgi:allophanate hydrolase
MPLNGQLQERGAELVKTTTTSDAYRFYALANTTPPKPGLVRVKNGEGAAIAIEIWRMPEEAYGSFVALIPSPLGIGQIETVDGTMVQGFLCEQEGLNGATDITHFKGWRSYLAFLNS